MAKQSSTLKKRRNAKKRKEKADDEKQEPATERRGEASKQDDQDDDAADDLPAWYVIATHPTALLLVFLGLTLGVPYPLRAGYDRGVPPFRPAVAMNESRQALIVGSMSSGTSQAARDLSVHLGLEVGHEDTDTARYHVRDGSVSWFHGIRFLDRKEEQRAQFAIRFCNVAWRIFTSDKISWSHPWSNYGTKLDLFGPTDFDRPHLHPYFRKSYLRKCHSTIFQEVGCAIAGGCPTPFRRALVQTRRPWRIVASLVTKYCAAGGATTHRPAPASLLNLFEALFPEHEQVWNLEVGDEQGGDGTNERLRVCTEQMATYVHLWYTALLDAMDRKDSPIRGSYPIETTEICEVAEMAGFVDDASVVYAPNADKVRRWCDANPDATFGNTRNRFNSQQAEDASGGGERQKLSTSIARDVLDVDLQTKVDSLHLRMGYSADLLPDKI